MGEEEKQRQKMRREIEIMIIFCRLLEQDMKEFTENEDDAQDVLQESYVKAWKMIDTLREPDKFSGWLGMIVANNAKSALRKKNPMLFSDIMPETEEGDILEFDMRNEKEKNQPEIAVTKKERTEQMMIRKKILWMSSP